MLEFTVKTNSEIRLSKAVFQYNPQISYAHLMSLLRKKDVMLNGKRINKDAFVHSGDVIRLYTTIWTADTYQYEVETVFENDSLLVYWKPKGLETQGEISLEAYARRAFPEAEACHRLDVNTDGLLIVAKSLDKKEAIVREMNEGRVEKFYLTALYGTLASAKIDKTAYLIKDSALGISRVVDGKIPGAMPIRTLFNEVATFPGWTIAEVRLYTGRTHQIRAQAFQMGNYVLGDGKYCPDKIRRKFPFKKQALSAYKLHFTSSAEEFNGLTGRTLVHDCELTEFIK